MLRFRELPWGFPVLGVLLARVWLNLCPCQHTRLGLLPSSGAGPDPRLAAGKCRRDLGCRGRERGGRGRGGGAGREDLDGLPAGLCRAQASCLWPRRGWFSTSVWLSPCPDGSPRAARSAEFGMAGSPSSHLPSGACSQGLASPERKLRADRPTPPLPGDT